MAITHVAKCATLDHVGTAQRMDYVTVHVERQASLFYHFTVYIQLCVIVEHILPCTKEVPVCGDTCNKVYKL